MKRFAGIVLAAVLLPGCGLSLQRSSTAPTGQPPQVERPAPMEELPLPSSALKKHLATGYTDGAGDGSPEDQAARAQADEQAQAAIMEYLSLPVGSQMDPAAFNKALADQNLVGSAHVYDLAPRVRLYAMDTRPDYHPKGYAYLQWWEDPARPIVRALRLPEFSTVQQASYLADSAEPRIIVLTATATTRLQTERVVLALRYNASKQEWQKDDDAFKSLTEAIRLGGVEVKERQGYLVSTRPDLPPVPNKVHLAAGGETIAVCDLGDACITFAYENGEFRRK